MFKSILGKNSKLRALVGKKMIETEQYDEKLDFDV